MSEAHHYVAPDGKLYVDTAFINAVQHVIPKADLKHMGFGEFSLETPDGEVEFDRTRGVEFPGQSGRSHQMYDSKGGQKVAEQVVKEMERKGKSERVKPKGESNMSKSLTRIQEMSQGQHNYDGWRLRELTEQRAHTAQADIVEHQNALGVIGKKLAKGDIAGVVEGLKEIQSRIGRTIAGLK
jgi:hypothetical protein